MSEDKGPLVRTVEWVLSVLDGCDHSVGICECGLRDDLHSLIHVAGMDCEMREYHELDIHPCCIEKSDA